MNSKIIFFSCLLFINLNAAQYDASKKVKVESKDSLIQQINQLHDQKFRAICNFDSYSLGEIATFVFALEELEDKISAYCKQHNSDKIAENIILGSSRNFRNIILAYLAGNKADIGSLLSDKKLFDQYLPLLKNNIQKIKDSKFISAHYRYALEILALMYEKHQFAVDKFIRDRQNSPSF